MTLAPASLALYLATWTNTSLETAQTRDTPPSNILRLTNNTRPYFVHHDPLLPSRLLTYVTYILQHSSEVVAARRSELHHVAPHDIQGQE